MGIPSLALGCGSMPLPTTRMSVPSCMSYRASLTDLEPVIRPLFISRSRATDSDTSDDLPPLATTTMLYLPRSSISSWYIRSLTSSMCSLRQYEKTFISSTEGLNFFPRVPPFLLEAERGLREASISAILMPVRMGDVLFNPSSSIGNRGSALGFPV